MNPNWMSKMIIVLWTIGIIIGLISAYLHLDGVQTVSLMFAINVLITAINTLNYWKGFPKSMEEAQSRNWDMCDYNVLRNASMLRKIGFFFIWLLGDFSILLPALMVGILLGNILGLYWP